jgi:hypothetical protein
MSEIPTVTEAILRSLSRKLDIFLASPENELVRQGTYDE